MPLLVLGLILFLGGHSLAIVNPNLREALVERLGKRTWRILYSLVALAGVILIIVGYDLARQDPTFLYHPPGWLRPVTFSLMLLVFPLVLAALLPGRIQQSFRYPLLVAVKTWAVAHLLVNGTVADVVLFGSFLIWAVLDRLSLKRRSQRPELALLRTSWNDECALVGGLALYMLFVDWAHQALIGMPLHS